MPAGFAVIGDPQWLPGYCVLLTDNPDAERLSDLTAAERSAFLSSMALLGEAVELACKQADPAFRRVNLEILGNTDAFLHAHVWPRYDWESPELVRQPVWLYPAEKWEAPETALGPRHDELRGAITRYLVSSDVSGRSGGRSAAERRRPAVDPQVGGKGEVGAVHHLELWVEDLGVAEREWGWLLGRLGYTRTDRWTHGQSWSRGPVYVVLEAGPARVAGRHDRLLAGFNHVGFHAGSRQAVEALVAEAPAHGWTLMFADRHPYAGGPEHFAAYLESTAGFEVELVADTT